MSFQKKHLKIYKIWFFKSDTVLENFFPHFSLKNATKRKT